MIKPIATHAAKLALGLSLGLALAAPVAQARTSYSPSYESGLAEFRSGHYAAALKDLTAAAQNGNAEAQQLLGHMVYMGTGVTQDFAQALAWYRKAAAQGMSESQYVIGTMY